MEFKLLGGHTALDFVNTVGGRTHTSERSYSVDRERLESVAELYEWAALAELITPAERRRLLAAAGEQRRAASAVYERALRLREALYRLFVAFTEDRKPDAADGEVLNRELALARAHEKLTFAGGTASYTWDARDALDVPLWMVARAAAELLTSDQTPRIRRCGGEDCGWLFLDTSRNRSRQWCDMRDCGNVAKVRRFRERLREG